MGFSCLPLWCNLYFMAYEIQFISRLLKLRRFDLLHLFEQAYRYIDDICILNAPTITSFLDPSHERIAENLQWIYPLNLVEIKLEMTTTLPDHPRWGIDAHFLSICMLVIDVTLGSFIIEKYDKRWSLPFKFQQYIRFLSNRPITQAYNIALS